MESKFLKVAKEAALKAGKIIEKYYGKKLEKKVKDGDNSNFATQADLEAEEIITKIIIANFPTHNIIAEEGGKTDRKSKYTWTIDPLDGTISFVSGLPFFAVSIGLLEENQPILGVINWVANQELYWAQKGKGAYLNGKRIHVSKIDNLEKVILGVGFGKRSIRQQKVDKYLLPLMNKVRYIYCLEGSAISLMSVAKGNFDSYATIAWIWDFAAGAIIVEEAGGKVTDSQGVAPDWTKDRLDIVASNGLIHDQILEALKS